VIPIKYPFHTAAATLIVAWILIPLVHQAQIPVIEKRVDSLLALMTLEEKAGQLSLFTNDWNEDGTFIKKNMLIILIRGWREVSSTPMERSTPVNCRKWQ